jgi:hypothetical protein
MNRHQRRAEQARLRYRTEALHFGDVDRRFDVQVEGKVAQYVMISANAKGRRVGRRRISRCRMDNR